MASTVSLMVFCPESSLSAAQEAVKRGVVWYEDFGAKGDGKTDDHAAIALAHKFANEGGLPVKANDTSTYYIGGGDTVVVIQTDTHFGKAKFIIDDTNVTDRSKNFFEVNSKLQPIKVESVASLKQDQRNTNTSRAASRYDGPTCLSTVLSTTSPAKAGKAHPTEPSSTSAIAPT